jgi:tRNA(Ile2) C34 agmatinyltransferase TiaS
MRKRDFYRARNSRRRRIVLRHERCLGELKRSGEDGTYRCRSCGAFIEIGIASERLAMEDRE